MTTDCERCKAHDREALEQVAKKDYEMFHGGKTLEVRTHFVCKSCGAKWVHTKETGLGGRGSSWSRE